MLETLRIPLLLSLAASLFLQVLLGNQRLSVTYDEMTFIPAGYSTVATGDFRMNREQPPLMKLLAGLPTFALRPRVPTEHASWKASAAGWANAQWEFGKHFLVEANTNGPELIFWSRTPVHLLASLLVVLVYLWARRLYGTAAGLLAAGLCAFSPNLIAHGQLATTDLGVTCFLFLAAYAFWLFTRAPTIPRLIGAGLGCGLALLAKFSAVLLIPLFGVWAILVARRRKGSPGSLGAASITPGRMALSLAAILAIGFFVTSLGYFAPGRVDLYLRGLLQVGFNVRPGTLYYLMGDFTPDHFPHYFLVAFLVKTPIPILVLVGLRILADLIHRDRDAHDLPFLLLPVVAFALAASLWAENIGLRYILPIYPFLFVYASGLVSHRAARAATTRAMRVARPALALLAVFLVTTTLRAFPDHLAYFNEAVGGPANGLRYLDDSNIDWGQDFKRLKRYLDRKGIERPKLIYSSAFDPALYGIDAEPVPATQLLEPDPPPGVYVVGATLGNRTRLLSPSGVSVLERFPILHRVGYSLYVIEIGERGEGPS